MNKPRMWSHHSVLFFDLDGALIDSKSGIEKGLNATFGLYELPYVTTDELSWIVGPPFQVTVPQLLAARRAHHLDVAEFIREYRKIYADGIIQATPLMPGIAEMLQAVKEDWPLAIVTSKPEPQARIVLETTGIIDHFDVIVGAPMDESVPKAVLLAKACELFDAFHSLRPKHLNSWMIGDRHHDIDAAVEEGVSSVGVMWGYGSHEEFTAAGATHIVHKPEELLQLLQSQLH